MRGLREALEGNELVKSVIPSGTPKDTPQSSPDREESELGGVLMRLIDFPPVSGLRLSGPLSAPCSTDIMVSHPGLTRSFGPAWDRFHSPSSKLLAPLSTR